jgi:hypothetical protein
MDKTQHFNLDIVLDFVDTAEVYTGGFGLGQRHVLGFHADWFKVQVHFSIRLEGYDLGRVQDSVGFLVCLV